MRREQENQYIESYLTAAQKGEKPKRRTAIKKLGDMKLGTAPIFLIKVRAQGLAGQAS